MAAMDRLPSQNTRITTRHINGLVSACIVVFFLAHGLCGSISLLLGHANPAPWLVWLGVACIVVHIILSIVTSRQQLTDTVRPPSEKKKRHLLLKWITGIALAIVASMHIASVLLLGPHAAQAKALETMIFIALAAVLAAHICFGTKSMLKDLGIDKRWRVMLRAATIVLATAIGTIALVSAISG